MNGIEWIVSQELKRQKVGAHKFLFGKKNKKHTEKDKEIAYQMIMNGASLREVEKNLGISKTTIHNIVRFKANKKD